MPAEHLKRVRVADAGKKTADTAIERKRRGTIRRITRPRTLSARTSSGYVEIASTTRSAASCRRENSSLNM